MKQDGNESIPCYVGRDKCGCVVSAIVDDPIQARPKDHAKEIKSFMRECINEGLVVGRETVGWVRENFGCKCKPKPSKQKSLIEDVDA